MLKIGKQRPVSNSANKTRFLGRISENKSAAMSGDKAVKKWPWRSLSGLKKKLIKFRKVLNG